MAVKQVSGLAYLTTWVSALRCSERLWSRRHLPFVTREGSAGGSASPRRLLGIRLRSVPVNPPSRIVSQVLLCDLTKRLEDPFLRRRVQPRILAISDQLRYGLLPQLAREHSGVGEVA